MQAEIHQLLCSYQNGNENIWETLRLCIVTDTDRIIQAYTNKGIVMCDESMRPEKEREIINLRNAVFLNDRMDGADNSYVESYICVFERDSYYTDPNRETFDEIFQFRQTQAAMGIVRDRVAMKN